MWHWMKRLFRFSWLLHRNTHSMIRIRLNTIGANGKPSSGRERNSPYERMLNEKRKQWFLPIFALVCFMHCAQTKELLSTWFYIFIILLLACRFIFLRVFFCFYLISIPLVVQNRKKPDVLLHVEKFKWDTSTSSYVVNRVHTIVCCVTYAIPKIHISITKRKYTQFWRFGTLFCIRHSCVWEKNKIWTIENSKRWEWQFT